MTKTIIMVYLVCAGYVCEIEAPADTYPSKERCVLAAKVLNERVPPEMAAEYGLKSDGLTRMAFCMIARSK